MTWSSAITRSFPQLTDHFIYLSDFNKNCNNYIVVGKLVADWYPGYSAKLVSATTGGPTLFP